MFLCIRLERKKGLNIYFYLFNIILYRHYFHFGKYTEPVITLKNFFVYQPTVVIRIVRGFFFIKMEFSIGEKIKK